MTPTVQVNLQRNPEDPWECLVSAEVAAQLCADSPGFWLVAWGVSSRGDPGVAEASGTTLAALAAPLAAPARRSSSASGFQVLVGTSLASRRDFQVHSEYKVCRVSEDALPIVESAVLEADADGTPPSSASTARLHLELNLHRAVLCKGQWHHLEDAGIAWKAVSVKLLGCLDDVDVSEPDASWKPAEWRRWLASQGMGIVTDATRLSWSCSRVKSWKARPEASSTALAGRLCQVIDSPATVSRALVVGPHVDKALSLLAAAAEGKSMRLTVLSAASLLEVGQSFAAVRHWLLTQAEAGSVIVLVRPGKWLLQRQNASGASDDFAGVYWVSVWDTLRLANSLMHAGTPVISVMPVLVCPLCSQSVRLEVGEDPNLTWERHTLTGCTNPSGSQTKAKKERCPVAGCKEVLTTSNTALQSVLHAELGPVDAAQTGKDSCSMLLQFLTSLTGCTLDNAVTSPTCEACGASRPAALARLLDKSCWQADALMPLKVLSLTTLAAVDTSGQGLVFLSLLAATPTNAWQQVFSDVIHVEKELAQMAPADGGQRSSMLWQGEPDTVSTPEQLVSEFQSSLSVLRPGAIVPPEVKDWLGTVIKASRGTTTAGSTPCCVALVGPPGCGKTSILQSLKHLTLQVLPMHIPQLIHAGIGDTQMAVRRLFESAQLLQPSCITLDDADELFLQASLDSSGNHGVADLLVELVHMLDTCCSPRLLFVLTCSKQQLPPSLACRLHFMSLSAEAGCGASECRQH
ncbi:SAP13 [Symbiodinium natans]|uniref:SAP13 protein n=1 Tax=Symbiodinium natans TaxID=878477 RepID=A0A812SE25_9DINO|nr:SAP13 [Symbiodinium natans]